MEALTLLRDGDYTFVAVKGEEIRTSKERGVKPLLSLLDGGEHLAGFAVADKVVGKAAAFLYVLLRADNIYAKVISKPALSVLESRHISVAYEELTDAIRNRAGTGFCPMESAVRDVEDEEQALDKIRNKLKEMKRNGGTYGDKENGTAGN